MNEFLFELKGHLLGELSPAYYAAVFIFAGIAILIGLYAHSRKRNPVSPKTPYAFSWRFLIADNLFRILITMLVIYVLTRFHSDWFGRAMSFPWAIGIGTAISVSLDQVIQLVQDKFNILKNR